MSFPPTDHFSVFEPSLGRDLILVVAAPHRTIDLLRVAVLRSDDVVFIAEKPDEVALRVARRFAVETRKRSFHDSDLDDVTAVLVSLDDEEAENSIVRSARRRGVAVHVAGRPLVSDFTLLALLQHNPTTGLAA